jgi:hypothetical protein
VGKRKALSLSSLEKKLDRLFSEWVRRSAADEGGTVECVTCQKLMHWTGGDAQAGHFVKRQHRATRWDWRNVNVQCVRCNKWLDGNEGEHGAYIIKKHGLAVHDELLALKRTVKKFSRVELQELIDTYNKKLEMLNDPTADPRRDRSEESREEEATA